MYRFGGLYADMDYECLAPLDTLMQDTCCCMGLDPQLHAIEFNQPFIVGNS